MKNPFTYFQSVLNGIKNRLSALENAGGGGSVSAGTSVPTGSNIKVYRALLTQSGTSAPVATVLENSLGGTIVWTRNDAGDYFGTLAGAFTNNKTFPAILSLGDNAASDGAQRADIRRATADIINLTTAASGALLDDVIVNASVEILVYP